MRKIYLIIIALLISLISPSAAFAHGSGLPPFFRINGQIPPPYFMQTAGIASTYFPVPQDDPQEKFEVGKPINFLIDTSILSQAVPQNIINKTKFSWDFGDGSNGEGVQNAHTYQKQGTYILQINAFYDPSVPTQVIESALINVYSDPNYQLPKAVLKVDGKTVSDPLQGALDLNLGSKLKFDATSSTAQTKITEYKIDYGDNSFSDQKTSTHSYKLPQYYVSALLRVKDENGFIGDTFVDLRHTNQAAQATPSAPAKNSSKAKYLLFAAGAILILGFVGFILFFAKKPKK